MVKFLMDNFFLQVYSMKKYFLIFLINLAFLPMSFGDEILGEEVIKPLRFPKFTVAYDFALNRKFKAFNNSNLKKDLKNSTGFAVMAEAGLLKYFNAGLLFNFSMVDKESPFVTRLSLFGKPYFSITDRLAIFSRLGTGLTISVYNELIFKDEILPVYGVQKYGLLGAGFNFMGSLGLEYFIFSRIGLTAEFGLRSDLLWFEKSGLPFFGPGDKRAPNWLNYATHGFPLIIGLHIIL